MRAIDALITRLISRKLLVFVLGTIFALSHGLPWGDWLTLALVYVGTQGAADIAATVLRACNPSPDVEEGPL